MLDGNILGGEVGRGEVVRGMDCPTRFPQRFNQFGNFQRLIYCESGARDLGLAPLVGGHS